MGIFAKGSQFPATVEADSPQTRYGDQLTKDSAAGDALGETIAEVNATASSANTTVGEMIADIEALEGRVDAMGLLGVIKTTWRHTSNSWHWVQVVNDGGATDGTIGVYIPAGKWAMVTRDASGLGNIGDARKLDPPTEFRYVETNPAVITVSDSWRMSFQSLSPATGWETDVYLIPFVLWEAWGAVHDVNDDVEVKPHTHVSADITDTTLYIDSTMGQAGLIPRTGTDGFLYQRDVPTRNTQVANKLYVDQQITDSGALTSTSGTGWEAWRRNGVTTLTFTGITDGFTLPDGYRPAVVVHGLFSYTGGSVGARFIIRPEGGVTLVGDIPNLAYGTITFVSPN